MLNKLCKGSSSLKFGIFSVKATTSPSIHTQHKRNYYVASSRGEDEVAAKTVRLPFELKLNMGGDRSPVYLDLNIEVVSTKGVVNVNSKKPQIALDLSSFNEQIPKTIIEEKSPDNASLKSVSMFKDSDRNFNAHKISANLTPDYMFQGV